MRRDRTSRAARNVRDATLRCAASLRDLGSGVSPRARARDGDMARGGRWGAPQRGGPGPASGVRRQASGVAVLALGGGDDAGGVFVGPLVGADLAGAVVVALREHRLYFGRRELVVARPGLVGAQAGDAA